MADIIDELAGMSDEDLAKKIGLDQKLADAKKHLGELAALSARPARSPPTGSPTNWPPTSGPTSGATSRAMPSVKSSGPRWTK